MKEHVSLLHANIEAMNLERKELAEKVALARDSKALLQQIHKSLGNLKFSHDEMGASTSRQINPCKRYALKIRSWRTRCTRGGRDAAHAMETG